MCKSSGNQNYIFKNEALEIYIQGLVEGFAPYYEIISTVGSAVYHCKDILLVSIPVFVRLLDFNC